MQRIEILDSSENLLQIDIQGYDAQAKTIFSQSTLLFNNLVLRSYLSDVLLRIKVFLVMRRSSENIKEKKKTDRRKTLKSEEKEKRII